MGMKPEIIVRIVLVVVLIAFGFAAKEVLGSFRTAPRQAEVHESELQVEVVRVYPEDVAVAITGYGEVRALDVVDIAPQVPGQIVALHPRLEVGEVIPKGELLFRIDPRDFRSARVQAQAQVEQLKNAIVRLKQQYEIDQGRVDTYRRTRDLAREELERDEKLYEDDVGTQSTVNLSEMSYHQANDAYVQIKQTVDLSPIRIREAENNLTAAMASLELAETSLERTEVHAPFDARVKKVQLEVGEYVMPGAAVLTLANDAILEISVSLDSRDARSWLQFRKDKKQASQQWFGALEPVRCRISWTEDVGDHYWMGTLARVERFEQTTRTVTVAVRVNREDTLSRGNSLPLVEGMFCVVTIPGKTMRQVYRLPRWAVTFEGTVYLSEDGRLKRRQVEVVRNQGKDAFVASGLEPGELVVMTRLVNPLPNTLLSFELEEPRTTEMAGPVATGPVNTRPVDAGPVDTRPATAEGAR